ncbi:MAG: SRPBCC domain-containing protein [Thermoproteota archaeon]|nr:SRPBCC domain-containing protein [Thermoproteota archaeon]
MEVATEEVRKTIIINASPEVAFRALTDESELTHWFSNERTVLEPQVEGAWMLKNCRSNTGEIHTMRGKILEIIQDKKLSHTWNVDEYPDSPGQLSHG